LPVRALMRVHVFLNFDGNTTRRVGTYTCTAAVYADVCDDSAQVSFFFLSFYPSCRLLPASFCYKFKKEFVMSRYEH
jgi:hypothetical protein